MEEPEMILRFPAAPDSPAAARHSIAAAVGSLDPSVLEDLLLLVSELVTNSFRHGGIAAPGWIEVRIAWPANGVRVEVSDPGRGFTPGPPKRPGDADSGWGLFLLDRIATRWGIAHGDRTRVWFEIDCEPRGTRRRRPTQDAGRS